MATKPTIVSIFDDFGSIVGEYSSGQTSDDQTPTLSGILTKPLKKKESLAIYSGNDLLGKAETTKKQWTFTPTSELKPNYNHSFKAIHLKKKGKEGKKSNSYNLTIDNIEPALIGSKASRIVNGKITFDFLFSEEIVGFTSKDIKVTGGSKGKLSGSGNSYSLSITPNKNSEGNIIIKTNPILQIWPAIKIKQGTKLNNLRRQGAYL